MLNLRREIERLQKGWRAFRLYRQCVRPGNLCFDIGANRGSRAVIFTLLGARTIALEPNTALTRKLRHFPRVTVVNKAVSDQPGQKKMLFNMNDQISSLNSNWRRQWSEFPEWFERDVECITLDQLVVSHGLPDFCKIDVEGHESAVLAGLTRPIPFLSFEASPGFEQNAKECLLHLSRLGDYECNFAVGDDFQWTNPAWVSTKEAGMLVETHAGLVH